MKTLPLALVTTLVASFSVGCSSVRYGDPDKKETTTIDWGSTDLKYFADSAAESLLKSPNLAYMEGPGKGNDTRVIAAFGGIQNETSAHINTDMISRQIQATLVNSGRIRFVARKEADGQNEIADEVRFQTESGRVSVEMQRDFGSQLSADIVIYGALSDITKSTGRSAESIGTKKRDVYYQFYLSAVNVSTGEILWTEVRDIRKEATVGLFGRG